MQPRLYPTCPGPPCASFQVVSKLPGAPDNGSLEVSVTLQAAKPQVQVGPMELVLPLPIKSGPPVLLTLRAHVQVRG